MFLINYSNNKIFRASGTSIYSGHPWGAGKLLWLSRLMIILLSFMHTVHGESSATKNLSLTGVNLSVRVLLQGPYDTNSGLMSGQLQVKSLLPVVQPYSVEPFSYAGNEQLSADVLAASGQDAVVDWMLLELRNIGTQGAVVAQKAVVLQRDGDLVDATTGETALNFATVSAGNYQVSIKHRNHQGVVTVSPSYLSVEVALVDFSSPTTQVQGEHARVTVDGFALLRGGDANQDGRLVAVGVGNDSNPLLSGVLLADGNVGFNASFQQQGYLLTDFNLDGRAVYSGPSNDNNLLLTNVLIHPGNVGFSANFIVGSGVDP